MESGYNDISRYEEFHNQIKAHKNALLSLIEEINAAGDVVFAYGASTRGNTVLQYMDLSTGSIPFAVDRNPMKIGREMSGVKIPIISEKHAREKTQDTCLRYLIILKKSLFKES